MSNWLNHWETRDPAVLYEEKEASTCKGCAYAVPDQGGLWCEKKLKPAVKKCARDYKEAE